MKWRLLTKCLVFVAFGLTLLFVGYSVGLLTQFRSDARFGGYCRIYDKVFLDKQLSTGAFDIALRRLEDNLDSDVAATNYSPTLADLPRLLRGTVFEHTQFNDDWRNKAIAMAAGFHRDRPDVVFSKEVAQQLDTFVPNNEIVRMSINTYALYKPRAAEVAVKQQAELDASREQAAGKKIYADSFLGKKAPKLKVQTWLTPEPETKGKFVLIDFWATWCGPCRQTIPDLNRLQEKFKSRLVVIGLGDEPAEKIAAMHGVKPAYTLAFDPQDQTKKAVNVDGIPHVLLVDPEGIVRWEGFPLLEGHELTDGVVEQLLNQFSMTASAESGR